MCGRFGRIGEGNWLDKDWSHEIENLETLGFGFNTYNAAPKQLQVVITSSKPSQFQCFLWGLIPRDSASAQPKYPYFNAKAETLLKIYPWNRIFPKQRCLIPAHFFYEWPKLDGKTKTGQPPYFFGLKGNRSFSFAGIWDAWLDPLSQGYQPSFTLITTEPNSVLRPYHNRMPVILTGINEEIWMNKESKLEELEMVLRPYDPDQMVHYPVSPLVGNIRNNEPALIKKIAWPDSN